MLARKSTRSQRMQSKPPPARLNQDKNDHYPGAEGTLLYSNFGKEFTLAIDKQQRKFWDRCTAGKKYLLLLD